jgi:hypothetical protein
MLGRVLLIAGVGFLIGYLIRARKRSSTGTEDFESELRHLEEATGRAKGAVDDLLRKAQRPAKPYQLGQPTVVGYGEGPKPGTWARLRKRVSDYFKGVDPPLQQGEIAGRLSRLKQTVNYITSNIRDNVTPNVMTVKTPQSHQKREATHKPSGGINKDIDDYQQDNTLPGVRHRMGDSQYDQPTISSYHRDSARTEPHGGPGPMSEIGSALTEIGAEIELYNRAVTDTHARDEFREQVQPIRVGTINAVERSQNPNIDPEFKEASDGDLLAFAIPGRSEYAVVPRLGLTIESVRYTAGALGRVFEDTQDYDAHCYYSRYSVRQPAVFKRDGDRWVLHTPGKLELGPSD